MVYQQIEDKLKTRKDRAKRAVALAMQNQWPDAVALNQSLIEDFPDDLEAYNRMGKALTEIGNIGEAKAAFQRVLQISPYNTIAKKNLDRLEQLDDERPRHHVINHGAARAFIEESGKSGVSSLVNTAQAKILVQMSPGDDVTLQLDNRRVNVTDATSGDKLGQVEPKIASRLKRLMSVGNRYQATVKSVDDHKMTIIIRETYKDPSQASIVSFPPKAPPGAYIPTSVLGQELGEDVRAAEAKRINDAKDWSDDDTEPGDDEAFTPNIHRIINSDGEDGNSDY